MDSECLLVYLGRGLPKEYRQYTKVI